MSSYQIATFAAIGMGGRFVEVFTISNEATVKIQPTTTPKGKPANARRVVTKKLIFMADWEPVFLLPKE